MKDRYRGRGGVAMAVRTLVRGFRSRVEAKARDVVESIPSDDIPVEIDA